MFKLYVRIVLLFIKILLVSVLFAGCGTDAQPTVGDEANPNSKNLKDDSFGDAGHQDSDTSTETDVRLIPDAERDFSEGVGTWSDPFRIDVLPFQFVGDTTNAPEDQIDRYACAPNTDESGPEYVFLLTVEETLNVRLFLNEGAFPGVDVDIHILSGPTPEDCIARDNSAIQTTLQPGSYWVTADTWVNGSGVELSGGFELNIVEETGAQNCSVNPINACDESDFPLVNGVPSEAPGIGGCPSGMVRIDAATDFCIDQFEAIVVREIAPGNFESVSPFSTATGGDLFARSVADVVPQGYISQVQAQSACANSGKRLCSDSEWVRACEGPDANVYPYGNTHIDDACNEDRVCHPVIQYFETTNDRIWSQLSHPCINQLPEGLAPTGTHGLCQSDEGPFDMMGNLHEWTSDPTGTFRGGFYVDTTRNGTGCGYDTTRHNATYSDYSTGFRCCADL